MNRGRVDVEKAKAMRANDVSVKDIARFFGVSKARIYQVLGGYKPARLTLDDEREIEKRAFRREVIKRFKKGESATEIAKTFAAPFAQVHLIIFDEKRRLREAAK